MKIVALIGSLRAGSYNRSVYRHYQTLIENGVTMVEGKFSDFPLYNGDIEEVGIPESVMSLGREIASADGLLFFTPEYNSSIPGVLKNAIDWLSRLDDSPLEGKTAAILSASPGKLGGARMQPHLRQVGVTLDIRFINRPEVMISAAHEQINEAGELTNESTKKHLKKHYDAFIAAIKKQKG